ncbi:hypothetical protein BLOT_000850 [Blomia tropicalis]|nr:hypothetical protein BLOT_000850 [Blomia tropicalis]
MIGFVSLTQTIIERNCYLNAMARRRRKSSVLLDRQDSTAELVRPLVEPLVRYAKRKKPDSKFSITVQVTLLLFILAFGIYTYNFFDHFHFHLTHFFATKWDDHHAQHVLGHKMLKNRTNVSAAFHWFRQSADRGHPHSAYNLAAGHLSGERTDVKKGEVRQLLKFAAKNGVEEAKELLRTLCKEKPSHCDL